MHRNEQLRRVEHGPESGTGHLENGKFGGGAEAVLYAAEYAVRPPVLAFELKYHIHDVLQNLRSGNVSVLGDMPDEDYGHPALLGEAQQ